MMIRSERLVAEISSHGAELIRLQDRDGKDLFRDGCEKWWTERAPLLFPILGGLPNNADTIDDETSRCANTVSRGTAGHDTMAQRRRYRMQWVLFVSLQWIVFGSPTQPTSLQIQPFASEELCNKAAEAIKAEINAPITGQRTQTLGRIVCVQTKDK
jgi:hypothetical protein